MRDSASQHIFMSLLTDWKGAILLGLSLVVLGLAACGGAGGGGVSHLSKRAFVSNDFDGSLHIEDTAHDVESGFTIATGSQPGAMALSLDKSITLVFDAGVSSLAVVSNSSESVLGHISLPGLSTSYVSMADNTVGFAAVTSSNVTPCAPRCVEVVNLATTFAVTSTINLDTTSQLPLNATTTLVLGPAQNKLLVFGGPGEHVDTLTVIDTATAETTPATAATQLGPLNCPPAAPQCLSRPVSAVFSGNSNTAYILNCGSECGGTPASASVTVLDLTQTPPALTMTIPVDGATTGLMSGNTLYVAGSPPGAGCTCPPGNVCETPATAATTCGRLEVINTAANPPTVTTSGVVISDGYHNHMELTSNNKLFIGAITCSAGCLTIYDTAANQPSVDSITGDVAGIAPITGRNVVYVVETVAAGSLDCVGQLPCVGKLRIYDDTASVPTLTPTQIDVVGKAVDVKYVDQ